MLELSSIRLKCDQTVPLPKAGALCVVGGNNVGKSQLLREIADKASPHEQEPRVILKAADYRFIIAPDEVLGWFTSRYRPNSRDGNFHPPAGGIQLNPPSIESHAHSGNHKFFSGWTIRVLNSNERQGIIAQSLGSPGTLDESSHHPLMQVYRDGELEAQISSHCQAAFGFPLTLDRASGELQFRVGEPDVPSPLLQRPTREYVAAVERLVPLQRQGDGVKNYLGMVAHFLLSSAPITIIDEPEGFLHPPQARSLGRFIGKRLTEDKRQLVTATHDRDFVLGLLESGAEVTFLRLDRVGDETTAVSLSSDQVRAIWDRPELRYSNLLQGLFHRAVVVCESDADCRWYAAVTDELARRENFPAEEILFLPAGGKSGVKNCLVALQAIGVPCFAILDFDVLLDPSQMKVLLDALDYDGRDLVVAKCRGVVTGLDNAARAQAKQNGIAGLPRGTTQSKAQEIVQELKATNILVVPIGELESFDGTLGGKSSAWVSRALEAGVYRTSAEAAAVVRPVIESLRRP